MSEPISKENAEHCLISVLLAVLPPFQSGACRRHFRVQGVKEDMAFSESEKAALLKVEGVGPTVVKRFEEIGIDSFDELAKFEPKEIAELVASMLRSTCWKNSPQALSAVESAINRAKQGH